MMFLDKVFIDSCSFDTGQNLEYKASHLIHNLRKQKVIDLMLVHSKEKEKDYAGIPDWVLDEALVNTQELEKLSEVPEKDCIPSNDRLYPDSRE
jgi:hypothetical protein